MKAVRFDKYGGIDVLRVADVPVHEPAHGQVLVKVKAASINPGEAKIREGMFHANWPATFPSGEGTDLAGIVTKIQNLTTKPENMSWEVAGSLAVAGSAAYASVRAF